MYLALQLGVQISGKKPNFYHKIILGIQYGLN